MPIRFEAYTADGVRRGVAMGDARLGDLIELERELHVTSGHLAPLDGSSPIADPPGGITVPTDDLFVVVAPAETPVIVHPAWHDVILLCGPYLVTGRMPTMPGFDPARALARPTGEFVLLDHVRMALAAAPDGGSIEHPLAWVNRYVVESVESDLELGFFFPGAESHLVQDTYTPGAALPLAPTAAATTPATEEPAIATLETAAAGAQTGGG
ncbi:MAG: hypothetical protein ACXWWR_08585 [Candidatus Limnocylindrales bacterium]